MSGFLVLNDVSGALRDHMLAALVGDPQTAGDVASAAEITFASPHDASSGQVNPKPKLSVFLYQLQENADLRSQPRLPTSIPGEYRRPPLSLDLRYLVTPLIGAAKDLIVLGRVMQALHDLTLSGPFTPRQAGSSPELRILLDPLPFEELSRLWTAFTEPYRLSVGYLVRVVALDSDQPPVVGPPVERRHVVVRDPAPVRS